MVTTTIGLRIFIFCYRENGPWFDAVGPDDNDHYQIKIRKQLI